MSFNGVSLVTFLISISFAENDVEVVLLRYRGLPSLELGRNSINGYYSFTFCACDTPVINPSLSPDCSCLDNLRAKSAAESTYQVAYSAACLHSYSSQKCLSASFAQTRTNDYFYVKILVGNTIVSSPVWQLLHSTARKTSESISTISRSSIDLTYAMVSKRGSEKSEWAKVAKTTPATPVRQPLLPSISNDYMSSPVQRLNSISAVRYFLLREGLRAGSWPTYFDVNMLKSRSVIYHNAARARHGSGPLTHDPVLEAAAQRWANSLSSRQECLRHEMPRYFGENLFYFAAPRFVNPDLMAQVVTQTFYLEGIGYNYNRFMPQTYHIYGHFTQLVWRSTRRMGVGVAIRNSAGYQNCAHRPGMPMIHVVVKYDPAGNFQSTGAYTQNVRPPLW